MNRKFIASALLVVAFASFVYGCGAAALAEKKPDAQIETASSKPEPVSVNIKLFTYKPGSIEVPEGTTVTWTNEDAIEHSVTNGTPDKTADAFDSDFFTKGQTYSFTFAKPGEYPYFCKRHANMVGTVKVSPASGHSGHSH